MAVFISYSHSDKIFVDKFAENLVKARHHVWLDRWELSLGDSITAKIEESLTESSAMLLILSKNSVQSQWCRREITAGLLRELEHKRTFVLPIVIDDCEIPLFLRDKLYADFRKDPTAAFDLVDRSLSKYTNPTTARAESPDFHTDFAVVWKEKSIENSEESWIVRWTFVDHGAKQPYVVISECKIYEVEGDAYDKMIGTENIMPFIKQLTEKAYAKFVEKGPVNAVIDDNKEQFDAWRFELEKAQKYLAIYSYRRLGDDNGMDTIVYPDNNLKMVVDHLNLTVK